MPVRVCFVQRGPRGDSITGVKLVAERSEESWTASPPREDGPLTADVSAAGDWLAAKLRGDRLDVICLDTEGSMCGWLSAASTDHAVVGALAREFGDTPGHEASTTRTALAEAAATPDEVSVALLGSPTPVAAASRKKTLTLKPTRLGVLAVSDVPARLLADALDERGITVGRITTLWHALAAVWDPSARTPGGADAPSSAPTTAIIAVDPSGRLIWVWSASGTLLAGGTMRVATEKPGADTAIVEAGRTGAFPLRESKAHVVLGEREASRLTAEWLAWSLELGRTPSRIIAVTPGASAGREAEHEAALAAFGQTLTRGVPGASMDLAEDRDPLTTTLTRLAERVDDAPAQGAPPVVEPLPGLNLRPTRAHRRLMILLSLGVTAMAAAAGAFAFRFRVEGGQARADAQRAVDLWRPAVQEIDAKLLMDNLELVPDKLDAKLKQLEAELNSPKKSRTEVRPVLDELATLTMILGDPEIQLTEVSMDNAFVTFKVVATLEQSTALGQALAQISGSNLTGWQSTSGGARGDGGFEYTFKANWIAPEPAKTAGAPK